MTTLADILELHEKSISDFGGSHGIRDLGLLEAAIACPTQTFGGNDLYLTASEKVAALGESLIKNHPFVDGNKRTGLLAMVSFLMNNGYPVLAKPDDLYNFIIEISTGALSFDGIVAWLRANVEKKQG